eukprot:gene5142-5962_t
MSIDQISLPKGVGPQAIKLLDAITGADTKEDLNRAGGKAEGFVLGLESAKAIKSQIAESLYVATAFGSTPEVFRGPSVCRSAIRSIRSAGEWPIPRRSLYRSTTSVVLPFTPAILRNQIGIAALPFHIKRNAEGKGDTNRPVSNITDLSLGKSGSASMNHLLGFDLAHYNEPGRVQQWLNAPRTSRRVAVRCIRRRGE